MKLRIRCASHSVPDMSTGKQSQGSQEAWAAVVTQMGWRGRGRKVRGPLRRTGIGWHTCSPLFAPLWTRLSWSLFLVGDAHLSCWTGGTEPFPCPFVYLAMKQGFVSLLEWLLAGGGAWGHVSWPRWSSRHVLMPHCKLRGSSCSSTGCIPEHTLSLNWTLLLHL